jgi:hypothetical protein
VEITEGAARQLKDAGLLPGKLRGHMLTLFRSRTTSTPRCRSRFRSSPCKSSPAFDVLPSLMRLWGWNDGHGGELAAKAKDKPKNGPQLRTGAAVEGGKELPY